MLPAQRRPDGGQQGDHKTRATASPGRPQGIAPTIHEDGRCPSCSRYSRGDPLRSPCWSSSCWPLSIHKTWCYH